MRHRSRSAVLALLLLASCHHARKKLEEEPKAELVLNVPKDGQVVYGNNSFLMATDRGALARGRELPVFFEIQRGEGFEALPQQSAPDLGPGVHSSAFDTTELEPGPLVLRARFADQASGPSVKLTVRRRPRVSCEVAKGPGEANSVSFLCETVEGEVVSYEWDFGDGTINKGTVGRVDHTYAKLGKFPWHLTVRDSLGIQFSMVSIVVLQAGGVQLQAPNPCGCTKMILRDGGSSVLRLSGTSTVPLGPGASTANVGFEIKAEVLAGSDPSQCKEGQGVRRSVLVATSTIPRNKRACSRGRPLPICGANADCNTHTCQGGLKNGSPCESPLVAHACAIGGGSCTANADGVCTEFPFTPGSGLDVQPRGNDDYHAEFPGDPAPKVHDTASGAIYWLDIPGIAASPPVDLMWEADFFSYVNGPAGRCACHFRMHMDWNGAAGAHRPGSGITLVADGETENCELRHN